ncbi:Rossmann-like domain-containing protein [Caldisericum exile]|uniref:Putative heavy-metal chelation domain-containing protein n=1 Tax=Caldisericum exile (strain DSM 21853 / NBRC 104410 / AZM16c01) TaxID=511051 RepID=A0A7U6GDU0_CALEA|nr:DUF364 domain-containing protein [Caldisericum exile]BAL80578.1 hypothetical protein CSE_04520 [Caldisericum exile AZM16c01]
MSNIYEFLKEFLEKFAKDHNIMDEDIDVVSIRPLTKEEAIGNPERNDFPILKGKEVMIEASFKGSKGQAFTDEPGNFKGTVRDLLRFPLTNNKNRAFFIASLNAILRHFGIVEGTKHCKNNEPELCSYSFVRYISENFRKPKIAFFGFQPAMISAFKDKFEIRVIDLDEDNIGSKKYGLEIFGQDKEEEIISWCDLIVATGSTVANGTIEKYISAGKPVIFYGVTGASVCKILNLRRFCPYSK